MPTSGAWDTGRAADTGGASRRNPPAPWPTGPVVHVTGARPNFPKAAPVMAALSARGVQQVLVHTGQHYDDELSGVFFRELGLPRPDVDLGVGSGSHAAQTAQIMVRLEQTFLDLHPSLAVVYGDVNSTVAAALVAAKLWVPLAHVEAGLRSFDLGMPEEVNRVLTDQLADLLLVTSPEAIAHLAREGRPAQSIHFVGNPMIDTLLGNVDRFDAQAAADAVGLTAQEQAQGYLVATLHRPANVDDPVVAKELVGVLHRLADSHVVVIPLHPRGRATLEAAGLSVHPRVRVVPPLGYLEFVGLMRGALLVLTDSGGVQEETTVLGVPCLTLRSTTERPVTITHGTNRLVRLDQVLDVAQTALQAPRGGHQVPPLWDGHAGERIADVIVDWLADLS